MSQTPWTVRSLKAALDEAPGRGADEITVSVLEGADEILLATMHWHGDLEIYISVSDQQVAASALLWPVDEQEDRHAFNEFLLKAQKLVPLSNFGICVVGGRDYYELFGELSTTTSIEDILIELRTLAENAIEVASDLRTSFSSAA
ncbi:DUF2170 domain-containing protein [Caulobacter zeae]|uniref:DUF2170 domain-containing protein n=1 Tax=Caulobacter zeae TaxID=2055137 RepID=A0A2N5DRS7_9CAUL|nr:MULTISPECIES: YjfI family protein [Caulobacter]MDG2531431.1 YjfI family protein [Caulobacter endophyticus]PLR28762.1 DUF2170 domain-containing protein [Caulobacter zeae]